MYVDHSLRIRLQNFLRSVQWLVLAKLSTQSQIAVRSLAILITTRTILLYRTG